MSSSRRTFLQQSAAAAAAMTLGVGRSTDVRAVMPAPRALRILIIGGTSFLGPHQVRYALERGHSVSIFTRGRTEPKLFGELFTQVEHLEGDRNVSLDALRGRTWDAVIDNSGQNVEWARESASLLANAARNYLFVSSTGVFLPYLTVGITEDVQPRLAEWNTLTDRLKQKDFQSVVSGWSVDFKFDPSETLGCNAGVYNYPSYCNPEADSLVRQGLTTLDQEQARPLWDRYQRIIHEEQPYTFLYYLDERVGLSQRLQGVVGDARGHLVSVREWWIPEAMRR